MNTPNKLTLLRLILVVPFIVFMALAFAWHVNLYKEWNKGTTMFLVSGIIFILAMITDFIDGHLARKNNQVTTFGKLFDPLADKFITTTAFIMLSIMGITPWLLLVVFVLRDILVDGSRNIAAKNNINVAASFWGKSKTMLQSIGLAIIFFIYPVFHFGGFGNGFQAGWELILLNVPVIASGVLSVVSGTQYFKAIIPYINTK